MTFAWVPAEWGFYFGLIVLFTFIATSDGLYAGASVVMEQDVAANLEMDRQRNERGRCEVENLKVESSPVK